MMCALPEWHGADGTPMPWWVERCYHAWVMAYWQVHAAPPVKRKRYGR